MLKDTHKMIVCMDNLVDFHYVVRCFRTIKYWFKVIESQDHKYVNIVYRILRNDIEIQCISKQKKLGKFIT